MKRIIAIVISMILLVGCSGEKNEVSKAIDLRNKLLKSNGCKFDASVSADYGDKIYSFKMNCEADNKGTLNFIVNNPDTIAGISGSISEEGGKLTFDNEILAFEMLADGCVSPVTAPWLMLYSIRGGYIRGCGYDNDRLYIQIDDSYAENGIRLELWTDENGLPAFCELYWQQKKVVSIVVENFIFL